MFQIFLSFSESWISQTVSDLNKSVKVEHIGGIRGTGMERLKENKMGKNNNKGI